MPGSPFLRDEQKSGVGNGDVTGAWLLLRQEQMNLRVIIQKCLKSLLLCRVLSGLLFLLLCATKGKIGFLVQL